MTVLLIVPAWSVLLLLAVVLCGAARRGDLALAEPLEEARLPVVRAERPGRTAEGVTRGDRSAAARLEGVAA
jgi:hypothetical protein